MSWKPQCKQITRRGVEEMNRNGRRKQPDLLGRFGPYIRERRLRENLSIRALAQRARMPHSNIHQMEMYRRNPNLTDLETLAKAFNQPLSEFLKPLLEPRDADA